MMKNKLENVVFMLIVLIFPTDMDFWVLRVAARQHFCRASLEEDA
jgi:hypothetical protein